MNYMRNLTLRIWEHGDAVSASLTIPLRIGGGIRVVATLTNKQVLEAMHRIGVRFSKQQIQQIGSLFGGIGKFLKKVSKSAVAKLAMKLGKAVVNSPIVKMVAPQVSAAIQAASMAGKLISAARGSDKNKAQKAKLAIVAARAQAEKESRAGQQLPLPASVQRASPEAQSAFRYMVTVNRAAA